jgi:hypothetical protein
MRIEEKIEKMNLEEFTDWLNGAKAMIVIDMNDLIELSESESEVTIYEGYNANIVFNNPKYKEPLEIMFRSCDMARTGRIGSKAGHGPSVKICIANPKPTGKGYIDRELEIPILTATDSEPVRFDKKVDKDHQKLIIKRFGNELFNFVQSNSEYIKKLWNNCTDEKAFEDTIIDVLYSNQQYKPFIIDASGFSYGKITEKSKLWDYYYKNKKRERWNHDKPIDNPYRS